MFAFADTPFDPDLPVYTRASARELLPEPVTPLSWSIIGGAFEEAFRVSFCDDLGLIPRPDADRRFQMVGRMAARLHVNLSIVRTTAHRMAGSSAAVVDLEYFGDPGAVGLPAHRPQGDDRRYRLKSPPTLGRTLAGLGRRVKGDRAAVEAFAASVDAVVGPFDADGRASAEHEVSSVDLVRLLRHGGVVLGHVLGTHLTARSLTSPILDQARSALARADIDEADALRLLSDIPDLETARPANALAELARGLPAGSALAEVVGTGSFAAVAGSELPGAAALHAGLIEFLAEFGHIGVNDRDPQATTWAQRPDDLVVLLAGIDADHIPGPDPVAVEPGRLARPLVAAARSAIGRAERTLDSTTRCTHQLRRLLVALTDRLEGTLDADLLPHCTLEEIEAVAHGGAAPAVAELERRRDEFRAAVGVEPAEWSDGILRLSSDEPASAPIPDDADGALLTGAGCSPGIGEGRVRILSSPTDHLEAGDVLVAALADVAWTPRFLTAAAVLTDVGGLLSHGAVVARSLGVPAVVGTRRATTTLVEGSPVRVDGTTGRVELAD